MDIRFEDTIYSIGIGKIVYPYPQSVDADQGARDKFSILLVSLFDVNRINTDTLDMCWPCLSARGFLLHIWWECPPIYDFWDLILRFLLRFLTRHKLLCYPFKQGLSNVSKKASIDIG